MLRGGKLRFASSPARICSWLVCLWSLHGRDLFMIISFRSCFLWAKFVRRGLLSLRLRYYWSLLSLDFLNLWSTGRPNRGCQQQTISNFHFLINNTHNSCQQRHSKSVVPGMNEWWRELKTESAQNKVRCSELLSAKRSINCGALWKLQNWYGIARVGGQGLL